MSRKQVFILVTFLLGVFMGAIDAGIVSPALTTLMSDFQIDYKWSVWVVTVYTLVYAVSMPIVSKLADIYGRKKVFIISIALFGLGSFMAGFSQNLTWLLFSRIIQAIGGGGIMPIANAVISESFPKEKRGMALGLVGATFGVATIIAPNLGGFITDYLSWQWIFFVNVPIAVAVIIMALKIPNHVEVTKKPLDLFGSILLSGVIITLMYGLTNLETNNILESFLSLDVWPFLLASLILLIPFVKTENNAQDPVIKIAYFKDRNIVIALFVSMITGIGMMSMIFIPAFSETLLNLSPGKGGYVTTILAVASGISAAFGGLLLDRWGAKKVIILGFVFCVIGSLALAFIAVGWVTLIIGLILTGFGIGFTMGAPLNYIILELTDPAESSVALSLVSLFRSIGITIGPIILVGFVSGAATKIPENIQTDLVKEFGDKMPAIDFSSQVSAGNGTSFSADRIVDMLPRDMPVNVVNKISEVIANTVQQTLLDGYTNLYISAAIIFFIGIVMAILLKLPERN
ncbi:MAG: MFS transporter [Vulcanibacillus sp.]